MNDAPTIDREAMRALRMRMRGERQARVGILRNPNRPPRPPARRAALTGRWLNLRSSRRPGQKPDQTADPCVDPARAADGQAASSTDPAGAAAASLAPVILANDGHVEKIDVAGLMASVDGIAGAKPVRASFAAEFRNGMQQVAQARADAKARESKILSREAWLDLGPVEEEPEETMETLESPLSRPHALRRFLVRLVLSGIGGAVVAVGVLIVLLGVPR